jgi:hypothetical protein
LRHFGETYQQHAELIRQQPAAAQRHAWIQLGAFVSQARAALQAIPGFNELRALVQSSWGNEISFVDCGRIVAALVQGSNGSLTACAAEGLTLSETYSRLSAPPDPTPERPDGTDRGEKPEDLDPAAARPALKAPPDAAVKAYRLKWVLGVPKQADIAKRLTEELGRPVGQGQVSRWLRHAEKFISAGGVLPPVANMPSKQPMPVDPERLDLGRRRDGRTERQRGRRSDDD